MEERNFTYDYFISYRRTCGGALAARHVKFILCKYGKKVFLDVDDIKKGEYEPQIYNAIENSKEFIMILNEESWREKEKIDVYYEEIIRITKQSGAIIPIEFAKNVLNNVPDILQGQLNRNIKKFEKVVYSHEEYFPFERKLCDKLGLTYTPDSKIENLPHFSMPFEIEEGELVKRDKKVREICDEIVNHRIYNLVGIGGCGKTTLTYLLADQYKNLFDNIAYVVVNGNIKEDFVAQINATLKFDFAQNIPIDDKYKALISYMDQYQTGNNLLILDVNETADKKAIEDYAKKLKNNNLPTTKIYPNGWNILILSREKFGDFHNEDISDDEDKAFLKELFLKKTGDRYSAFEDFDGLLDTIYYSPLLAEQLGIFLKIQPKTKTLAEIKDILYGDLRDEEIQGINAYNREERTLIHFLKNLVDIEDYNYDEQNVLRHFILWGSDYIGYDIIKDLLQGVCYNLDNVLVRLSRRNILSINSIFAYKLNNLLYDSLSQQFEMEKADWSRYLSNIERVIGYDDYKFESFIDCIANSLKSINFMSLSNKIAYRFYRLYKSQNTKQHRESYINKEPIYISYAHNSEKIEGQEHIADVVPTLIEEFIRNGIKYRIDEKMEGGDSITEFEEAIGKSMYIIIVFNKKYFESPHCMYEFKKIINNKSNKKIICINSDNINLDEETLQNLYEYWTKVENKLEWKSSDILKKIELAATQNKYYKTEIKCLATTISDILHYKTNNTHTLFDKDLKHLINSVKKWFSN